MTFAPEKMSFRLFVIMLMVMGGTLAFSNAHEEKIRGKVTRAIHVTHFKDGIVHTSDKNVLLRTGEDPRHNNAKNRPVGVSLLVSTAWTKKGPVSIRIHDPNEKNPYYYLARSTLHSMGACQIEGFEGYQEFYFDVRGDLFEAAVITLYDEKGFVVVHCHKDEGEQGGGGNRVGR